MSSKSAESAKTVTWSHEVLELETVEESNQEEIINLNCSSPPVL